MDLFEEPEKENSLSRNKVENEKTKKVKRRKLKEISNGNNVDGACQKKTSKRPKHGVPTDEVKGNENAEMETKVGVSHGVIHVYILLKLLNVEAKIC